MLQREMINAEQVDINRERILKITLGTDNG